MKKFILFFFGCFFLSKITNAQSVGVNGNGAAPNPAALLHVDIGTSTTKGLLITGTAVTGTVPNLGPGSRLMFYPGKAAFRAGYVLETGWDDAFVGYYSVAMGNTTTASGNSSTAMGIGTISSNKYSTAIGNNTTASGESSTTMGSFTNASGDFSTAMGSHTTASGGSSTAMGFNTIASGNVSTAMGSHASTNLNAGSFVYGDASTINVMNSTAANQFMVRAAGGTIFYSNSALTAGVSLLANNNFWVGACDKNRKENFEPLNGDDVLQKIAKINFTSWNYKMQDAKTYRHYGIMAQDFYNAFGHDKYGTIGNDTTVNPIDMIGIDMTAIQALEKRTTELKNQNAMLNKKLGEVAELKNEEVKQLKKENGNLKQSFAQLEKKFDQLKALAVKQTGKEPVAIK